MTCQHCRRAIALMPGNASWSAEPYWYHPDTMSVYCDTREPIHRAAPIQQAHPMTEAELRVLDGNR